MTTDSFSAPPNNRILVVSGGGSRGAWGAGFASYLSNLYGTYKVAFGTSTGSLMIPFLVTGEFSRLREAYTCVTQKDIFDSNPFKDNGELKISTLVFRLLLGKPSLGESKNLRKLIDTFLTDEIYARIRNEASPLMIGVTVVNMQNGRRSVKCSADIADVKEMRDWIWASANQPLFMTYFRGQSGGYYVDGGVYDTIPVMPALQYAAEHQEVRTIDVIINQPRKPIIDAGYKPTTILKGLTRLVEMWKTEVADDDVLIGLLAAGVDIEAFSLETITINLHYFPQDLYKDNQHDLHFSKAKMQALWRDGESGHVQSETHGQPMKLQVNRKKIAELMKRIKDNYE